MVYADRSARAMFVKSKKGGKRKAEILTQITTLESPTKFEKKQNIFNSRANSPSHYNNDVFLENEFSKRLDV